MNPSPIKRNKNLLQLSRDHPDGLLVVWKLRQGFRFSIQNERMAEFAIHEFNTHLKPHFINEEELLFVTLPQADGLRLKAEEDHAIIKQKVAAMQPTYQATNSLIDKFAGLLEEHIRFEERILFPYIEKIVAPEDLEKISLELEKRHPKGKAIKWKDDFWVRK